jgi:hypothetical protein
MTESCHVHRNGPRSAHPIVRFVAVCFPLHVTGCDADSLSREGECRSLSLFERQCLCRLLLCGAFLPHPLFSPRSFPVVFRSERYALLLRATGDRALLKPHTQHQSDSQLHLSFTDRITSLLRLLCSE